MSPAFRTPIRLISCSVLLTLAGACGSDDAERERSSFSDERSFSRYNSCALRILDSPLFRGIDRDIGGNPIASVELPTARVGQHQKGGRIIFFVHRHAKSFWYIADDKTRRYLFSSLSPRDIGTESSSHVVFDFSLGEDVDNDGVDETTYYFTLTPSTGAISALMAPEDGVSYPLLTAENRTATEAFDPKLLEEMYPGYFDSTTFRTAVAIHLLMDQAIFEFENQVDASVKRAKLDPTNTSFPDISEYQNVLVACRIPGDEGLTTKINEELARVEEKGFPSR